MEATSSSNPRPNEKFMHKNRLQQYAQRSALQLPVYQTVNEGSSHAPRFRSTVIVDGETFRSLQTFSNRKEAEQNVAKVALEGISLKIKREGCPLIRADITFCRSILNEYAVKVNLEKPIYTCTQSQGLLPIFVSSVLFAGKMYKGTTGRNKKEAQQLAARAIIESILGDCDSSTRTLMSQIIKSKVKLYAAINRIKDSNVSPVIHVASEGNVGNCLGTSLVGGEEVQSASVNEHLLVAGHVLAPPLQISDACLSPVEGMRPKEEYICEVNTGAVGNGASPSCQLQGASHAAQISTISRTFPDDSHHRSSSPVKNENCEGTPAHWLHRESSGVPILATIDPSGLSSGTQGTSSSGKKRRSKKGKRECGDSDSKKSRISEELAST
uniref:Double-stranded RNA-binding protein 4 n=1 Tax=Anthurium amnicola TaxID=1678845 RepID=A0A1D1ZA59_9ARAE